VIVQFVGQQLSTIPAGLLCNYLYESLKHFLRRKREDREASIFDISFDPETGRLTQAHIRTGSEEVLKEALDKLPDIISSNIGGAYGYSGDEHSWKQLDS